MNKLKLGKYEHYKGGKYEVIGLAKHTETLEKMVVYRSVEDNDTVWVRPLEMFLESVNIEGKKVPRFKYIN